MNKARKQHELVLKIISDEQDYRTVKRHLEEIVSEMIVIPNSWLPERFHDNKRGGRTVARLNAMCDKRDGLTEHRKIKAIKARNIKRLARQVQDRNISCPLDYSHNESDDIALHRNEMALVAGMISGGLIDAEDILES